MNKKGYTFLMILIFIIFVVVIGYNGAVDLGYLNEPNENNSFYDLRVEKFNETLLEEHIFNETNNLRVEHDLKPLMRSEELFFLAQYHSDNMIKYKFYDHTDFQGYGPDERAQLFNINIEIDKGDFIQIGIGENIGIIPWHSNVEGCGDTTKNIYNANCMFKGWVLSQGHYKNLIGDYEEIGIGVSYDIEKDEVYYTQNFR